MLNDFLQKVLSVKSIDSLTDTDILQLESVAKSCRFKNPAMRSSYQNGDWLTVLFESILSFHSKRMETKYQENPTLYFNTILANKRKQYQREMAAILENNNSHKKTTILKAALKGGSNPVVCGGDHPQHWKLKHWIDGKFKYSWVKNLSEVWGAEEVNHLPDPYVAQPELVNMIHEDIRQYCCYLIGTYLNKALLFSFLRNALFSHELSIVLDCEEENGSEVPAFESEQSLSELASADIELFFEKELVEEKHRFVLWVVIHRKTDVVDHYFPIADKIFQKYGTRLGFDTSKIGKSTFNKLIKNVYEKVKTAVAEYDLTEYLLSQWLDHYFQTIPTKSDAKYSRTVPLDVSLFKSVTIDEIAPVEKSGSVKVMKGGKK